MVKKGQKQDDSGFDFESSLKELEQLVERMEQGELTLESSLQEFERGITLTRGCQQALQQAEQRVEVLLAKSASAKLAPFNEEGE